MPSFTPSYISLYQSGELAARAKESFSLLSSCSLCPRACGANRLDGERGWCGAADDLTIASTGPHFGEEPPLSGDHGAGTIFFTHCSLKCCYCQNYQISHEGVGKHFDVAGLTREMLHLQQIGCHNIDLVTATHYVPFVLQALLHATKQGLRIPLLYNCSGYESVETLTLLEGVIDLYLPDWKYGDTTVAAAYSQAPDYPAVCKRTIAEMLRQVGDLQVDEYGIAQKGLIVRHLVLPGNVKNSAKVFAQMVAILPETSRISLMAQYTPHFQAMESGKLQEPLSPREYEQARALFDECGFLEYWVQELDSSTCYSPDFTEEEPFQHC